MDTRIVFMGSPDFAIPTLKSLIKQYPVIGVVTQPDRQAGRGQKLVQPPVKVLALKNDIPIIQPKSLRNAPDAKIQLEAWNPDVFVVAAFGQILEKEVLNSPPHGCLNVHASLLPRWRGVSPIQAAILNGDHLTGVTVMKMDEGVDTGDILAQYSIPIETDDTGGSLFNKLAQLGADLLIKTLPSYIKGEIIPKPQGSSPTPYAPMLKKSDGELDFAKPAETLERQVRAFQPWPGTYTYWQGKLFKIHQSHVADIASPGEGIFIVVDQKPAVGTSKRVLVFDIVQPAGKKAMAGEAFLFGAKEWGNR